MLKAFLEIFQLDLDPISKQCQRWGAAYVHQSPPSSQFDKWISEGRNDGRCLIDDFNSIAVCGDFLASKGPRGGMSLGF